MQLILETLLGGELPQAAGMEKGVVLFAVPPSPTINNDNYKL